MPRGRSQQPNHVDDAPPEPPVTVAEEDTTLLPEEAAAAFPDSPLAATDYGVTAAEEERDEPLSQRLGREVPDVAIGPEARGDLGDLAPEEAAMHLLPEQPARRASGAPTGKDRLDLLEAQVAALLTMSRVHTEVLQTLAVALERLPIEAPDEAANKVSRAARQAHDLLLASRTVPD